MSALQNAASDSLHDPVDPNIHTLIIGCGNLLRGDDAVGPILIRRLWQRGLPAGVRCADGGTGGMDVAFQMRRIPHVIIVDAANTGAQPGTLFEVPGEELESVPPLSGLHPHAFRWDHAIAFGRWLLKEDYPTRVTVYLIEGTHWQVGDELSEPVHQAIDRLTDRILDHLGDPASADAHLVLSANGYLQIDAKTSESFFPDDHLVAFFRNGCLTLLPTRGPAAGGLLLKRRNPRGDRSLLLSEVFHFAMPVGTFPAYWNPRLCGLEVRLPEQRNQHNE